VHRVVRDRHDADARELPAVHQVLEPLPAIAPGLARDTPVFEVEHVEEDQRHRAVGSLSLGEHGLDALVPIAGAGFAVEHGGAEGPRELAQPGHAGLPQQVQAGAAVADSRATGLDVELGALTVELRLGDVAAIGESSRVREPLAEHRRAERCRQGREVYRTSAGNPP